MSLMIRVGINLIVVQMTTIDVVIVIVMMGAQQWNTWLFVISWY